MGFVYDSVAYVLYAVNCPHIPRTTHYFNKERTNTMIIHFYSYPVLKLKRISILRLTLKGLLITLRLIILLCMLHLLLIVSCRIGLMLWMRIGVRKYYTFHTSLYAKEISASVLSPISSSVHSSLLP